MQRFTFIEHEDVIKKILKHFEIVGDKGKVQPKRLGSTHRCVSRIRRTTGSSAEDYIKDTDYAAGANLKSNIGDVES